MRHALQGLNDQNQQTYCQHRPVPFTEIRQTPQEAARLCHRGEPDECPIISTCAPLGFTESVYADDMVYGGYAWKRGKPVVSETIVRPKRGQKITNGKYV
jgi:hypothetical protein